MQCALKLRCAAVAAVLMLQLLCGVARPAYGAPQPQPQPPPPQREPAAVSEAEAEAEATVEELPQRPMTLQNGYHPGLFPFNNGEPFVVDPSTSAIDFNTRPPPAAGPATATANQRSDDYYDYDASKLEEVPYDYKGDPIDRKDVVEPGAPRPNDIKPSVKNKQTDIYQFLNLPVKYSSSDKFPLMSSSYANTKIQGSGSSSSSLSNHKMPAATPAPPTTSWYNPAAKTTARPPATAPPTTTTTTTSTTSTTTTTTPSPPPPPSQEYEEESVYDYDYYHPQEPALMSDAASSTSTTTTTTTAATTTTSTTTTTERQNPPSTTANAFRPTVVVASSFPSTAQTLSTTDSSTTASSSDNYDEDEDDERPPVTVSNKTTSTTTARPEIDSKLDGPSFADYDAIKPTEGGEHRPHQQQQQQQQQHQHELYGASGQQHFKPMPGNYQYGNDKTYPLITSGKVPMTFTAHVSSGISLNQKEPAQQQHHHHPASEPAPPPYTAVNRPSPPEVQDSDRPADPSVQDGPTKTVASSSSSSAGRPYPPPPLPPPQSDANRHSSATYPKQKPPVRPTESDHFETVYFKVRPDAPAFPSAVVGNRPAANPPPPVQGRPYQPEPPVVQKTSDRPKPPQQPYPDVYAVKKPAPPPPQYVAAPAPSPPDTSKFKPPKHVINHFIKTQPNEDNKSYALQTSFSIGMDAGDRTAAETRPAQGVGQVLMVEDGSPEPAIFNQTAHVPAAAVKPVLNNNNRATTSMPFVPPPPPQRPVQKPAQQQYPRPQWENIPKPPTYYPPPKRDGPAPPPPPPPQQPPPQRTNLPNILPQFRPNAKVDAPPMMMAPAGQPPHSATIERVQIPMDHLRPPPLPKPQFLKVDRNDEDVVALDMADTLSAANAPDKETRILHRAGPAPPQQQPARVTTLQMIQHGASSAPANNNNNNINNRAVRPDDKDPVHVVYAANAPPPNRPSADRLHHADDSVLLDPKDRSDVPVLKTKTAVNRPPVKTDFPYQIVKPDDSATAALEYKAYSPTKPDAARPNDQELVPNLQDYVPVVTRGGGGGDPAANVVLPQKPITATLRTNEDNNNNHNHNHNNNNHKTSDEGGHKPQLQNFQIPFQPSMKLPENSNGWSVVRKSQVDSASERVDETGSDAVTSTEKFDPDNFKPQLVGGFMPINPLTEEAKEKKTAEQPERA